MNVYSDELDSDASIDGAWSFNYVRHRNYIRKVHRDVLSSSEVGKNGHCFNTTKRQLGLTAESEKFRQFDEDFYLDQYDDAIESLTLDDLDKFDIASENRLMQLLNVTPLTDDAINNSKHLAKVIAKEAVSNRRLAMLLAASAARKEKVLTKWSRKLWAMVRNMKEPKLFLDEENMVSSLSSEEFCAMRQMKEVDNARGFFNGNMCSPHLHNMTEVLLDGVGQKNSEPSPEDQNMRRRLCRHFLKGHCKRGNACDFLHDSSIFCPEIQKVFLGGLPSYIVESTLREKLAEQGYTVINKPKVLRGFTPQVCLGSVQEAQRMIKKGKIMIDDVLVDVRPYEAFAKDNLEKKLPIDINRSVFLGGLPNGTTGQMIKDELEELDVKVVNHPLIKTGFTPQVILGSKEQAQKLVNLKKVRINNTLVDVRPYVNLRERYGLLSPTKK